MEVVEEVIVMLVANRNNKPCSLSFLDDGACCCNCKWRFTLMVDNSPIGYVCNNKYLSYVLKLKNHGHDMCECHEFVGIDVDKMEII